ncbi:MAG: Rieske 2Fe-2S domain-containing protein [Rhodospirillaceae bacterium]
MSDWKKVCAAADVPENALRKFDIDGKELAVANYGDGFRVFPPYCPHMLEPLAVSGMLDGGILTCGKHLWQWDLKSGEMKGLSEKDILLYDCKVEGGDILADLSQELSYDWEEEDELDDDDFFN